MRLTRPVLAVSRSHDGFVLIVDATSPALAWRLTAAAAGELVEQLRREHAARHADCAGVIKTCGGAVVTFTWPRRDVDGAIADLQGAARLVERGR